MSKVLIVGGTGPLGRLSVNGLTSAGLNVRCLVRPGRESEVTQGFVASGVELAHGDLKDPPSLLAACRGIDVVVNMASATLSQTAGDTIETVDHLGGLNLVDAAESASVRRFVFISFAGVPFDFALGAAKEGVCQRLKGAESMTHAVLKSAPFMEAWLPLLAPAQADQPAVFFGSGDAKVSWITRGDVAQAVVAAAQGTTTEPAPISLGGPEELTQREVFEIFQAHGARQAAQYFVDREAIERELVGAQQKASPLEEAFAIFKLALASGIAVSNTDRANALLPSHLTTVREFVVRYLEATPSARA
ncbi:MAG: NmrA family NAD(P)-binding protein [Pseudomonadota bacterium]